MSTISLRDEQRVIDEVPTQLLIGGQWLDASRPSGMGVEDPSTGEVLVEVADASPADGHAAAEAAHAAQADWAGAPARDRAEILRRAFEALVARRDDIALLITLEMGKSLRESQAEVSYGAEFFRWFSEEAVRIGGEYRTPPEGAGRILVTHHPVGPCLLITPWNFPLAMATRKIGPAIAAGCTMVAKPAAQAPLTTLLVAKILQECGLPAGVLNVLTTSTSGEVMRPLIEGGLIRKLSFTGSTEVGRRLLEQGALQVLRMSMELGGNAPFVVFDDADLEAAIEGAMIAKMRNIGESCVAANRFLIHESVAADFARGLAERMRALRVGRGTDEGVDVGPLIDAPSRDKVGSLVGDATGRGARAIVGGAPRDGRGYFFEPTVLIDVPAEAELVHEEIFGPVAPVLSFGSEDEAVALANASPYGLASYLYTKDLARALRVAERLEAGMVGLNRGLISNPAAPFGGVKWSGLGREGGREGVYEFLDPKYVAVQV